MNNTKNQIRVIIGGAITALLATMAGELLAIEIVDGGASRTIRNGMHSCPPQHIVTGVHLDRDQLLCQNFWEQAQLVADEIVHSQPTLFGADDVTRRAFRYAGPGIPFCGADRFLTGIDATTGRFACARLQDLGSSAPALFYSTRLGRRVLDENPIAGGPTPLSGDRARTIRQDMHACPKGFVLVGADFASNTFLCTAMPTCLNDDHCPDGRRCERGQPHSDNPLRPVTGICRPAASGQVQIFDDPVCRGDEVGSVEARESYSMGAEHDEIRNNEAASLRLVNVAPATAIVVVDEPDDTTDDKLEIAVFGSRTVSHCLPRLEANAIVPSMFRQTYHPESDGDHDLEEAVSSVWLASMLQAGNDLCADVPGDIRSGVALQVFGCHGGDNQRALMDASGRIFLGGLCLDVRHGLPEPEDGTPVQIHTCHDGDNQRWAITHEGEIRSLASNKCLDVAGELVSGRAVQIWNCHGGTNQRWHTLF